MTKGVTSKPRVGHIGHLATGTIDIPASSAESDTAELKGKALQKTAYGELPKMNAQAIFKSIFSWNNDQPSAGKSMARDFPPEAYSYDGPISKEAVAQIQQEANKKLDKQQWTVIERLGDGGKR